MTKENSENTAGGFSEDYADDANALFILGTRYSTGRDVQHDLVAAHKWFNLAALKGRSDAISLRREVAALMSDVEIATAQREARAWMTSH